MDLSSLLGTLMSSASVQGLGQASNTNSNAVQSVLGAALPSLISGAQAQSQDTATGFADALLSHSKDDTSDLASFLGKVDLEDGGKIISHLLGKDKDSQLTAISNTAGVAEKDTSNILSAAAPLLMSLLGKESVSSAADNSSSAIGSVASGLLQNVDVGSILAGILGGGNAAQPAAAKKTSLLGKLLGKLLK